MKYVFLRIAQFSSYFLLHTDLKQYVWAKNKPFPKWTFLKFGILIRHILAYLHLKFEDA